MNQHEATACVDELFESWYAHLLRYATRMTGQRQSAEEVVQDTFLALYRALRTGSDVQYPRAWTMCVVRRIVYERRREHFGVDQKHEALEDSTEVNGDWSAEIDLAIDCERVRRHLSSLSVREEEVLMLRLQSMKYREIAEALGISINTVNTLLARALEKMQKELHQPTTTHDSVKKVSSV
jgi:RNA polymerase sigma-70 factor (ECF subfamily)